MSQENRECDIKWKRIHVFHDPGTFPRAGESRNQNISFSGDIQDPPGQDPVQPTVGDPASAGRLD